MVEREDTQREGVGVSKIIYFPPEAEVYSKATTKKRYIPEPLVQQIVAEEKVNMVHHVFSFREINQRVVSNDLRRPRRWEGKKRKKKKQKQKQKKTRLEKYMQLCE